MSFTNKGKNKEWLIYFITSKCSGVSEYFKRVQSRMAGDAWMIDQVQEILS